MDNFVKFDVHKKVGVVGSIKGSKVGKNCERVNLCNLN